MPDIQFWDDKLTEEIQFIQILVASRDELHTSAEDDQQIDKLLRDASRTRRCLRSQTKMLPNDDPDHAHFAARLQLLDGQLTALEFDWQSMERSDDNSEPNSEPVYIPQSTDENDQECLCTLQKQQEDSKELDDTQTTTTYAEDDNDSTNLSVHSAEEPRSRPTLVRSQGMRMGTSEPFLSRTGSEPRLHAEKEKQQKALTKRFRQGLHAFSRRK